MGVSCETIAMSCKPVGLILLATILLAGFVAYSSADPPERGLLGATEAEVAKKLGEPDDKLAKEQEATYAKSSPLRLPVVKRLYYPWKKFKVSASSTGISSLPPQTVQCFLAVGYDANGVARTVEPRNCRLTAEVLTAVHRVADAKWQTDKFGAKIFPTVTHDGLLYNSGEYLQWDSNVGVKIGRRVTGPRKVIGSYHAEKVRPLSVSDGLRAYALGDFEYDTRNILGPMGSLVIADAATFWKWTLDDISARFREGPPKVDEALQFRISRLNYEEALGMVCSHSQYMRATADRLTYALTAAVKNPAVELAIVRKPVLLLNDRYDQSLTKQLCTLLASPASDSTKARAASVLAWLDDPAAIEPLIQGLRSAKPLAEAAATLKELTGQAHGFDPDAWSAWWKENRQAKQQAHEARKKDRLGNERVAVLKNSKNKHYHDIPNQAYVTLINVPEDVSIVGRVCNGLFTTNSAGGISVAGFENTSIQKAWAAGLKPCPQCKPPGMR